MKSLDVSEINQLMKALYPLKFQPITQYRIWGGDHLNQFIAQEFQQENLGEIWSISALEGNVSIIENGVLKGENLQQLIEMHQAHLLGEEVWQKFGNKFPLLIKFLNAQKPLSVQVHPNDELAESLHQSSGKTEMWYIMEAEPTAEITMGFQRDTTREEYLVHLKNETLEDILHREKVKEGDVLYIPAGRAHAIGAGIVLAEIQQASDITYRIYDYNRKDKDGKTRELHTDWAEKAIDFHAIDEVKSIYQKKENQFTDLVKSPYFQTRIFKGNQTIEMKNDREMRIYICVSGELSIVYKGESTPLSAYQSILIPAACTDFLIQPHVESELIEVRV